MRWHISIIAGAFLLFGCNKQFDSYEGKTIESVKSIETVFISHQADTEEKDNKIVAMVEFMPDGSIKSASQYMTYPYTHMEKEEFVFWNQPNNKLLPHLLDGLTLGHAEKNFLYGNSWPTDYAEMIDKMGHPQFPKKQDIFSSFTSTVDFDGALPAKIKTEPGFDDSKDWFIGGYEEKFSYDKQKVTSYEWRHVMSEKMLMDMQEAQEAAINRESDSSPKVVKSTKVNQSSFKKIAFMYEGEKLIKVVEDEREHRFQYDSGRLSRAEYYINDVLRNHRVYSYFENGLKEQTVIFNTNNEPEYTIKYQYTFFEES